MEGKVHIVTCGVSSQTQEIVHALTDCMQSGYWLVMQNAHLAEPWNQQMLSMLKVSCCSPGSVSRVVIARPSFSPASRLWH